MKGKLNKLKKLLCYLIVSIVVFGIGGEVVNARVFYSRGTLAYRTFNVAPYRTSFQWFYPADDSSQDAWCLNSTANPSSGYDLPATQVSLIPAEKKQAVINVITAGRNLNLSAGEKYYVTQAAIWYVLNGTGTYGITPGFRSWLETRYSNSWRALVGEENLKRPVANPSMSINGSNYTLETSGGYLVSQDFTISATDVSGNFTVSINNGSADGACILYNDSCTAQATLPANSAFKIRVNIPNDASGTVDASFTATPVTAPSVYDIDTYLGLSNYGVQNMAVLTSRPRSLSATQQVKGNYVNNKSLEIQKTDTDTGAKVAGAKLYVEDENGNRIGNYTSTGVGAANPTLSLPVGRYFLGESTQPEGYYWSSEKVEFNVTDVGGELQVLDHDGNQFPGNVPTVSLSNERIKIKFKKVDVDGNPVAGVKMTITSYANASTRNENAVLCAYTDSNGYLTIPCNGNENTNNVRSDGEYTFGIDFGDASDIYEIREFCDTDACQRYMLPSGEGASFHYPLDFGIYNSGRTIISFVDNIEITHEGDSDTPLIVMNLINRDYLNIRKQDITTGAEVAGAHLYITDLTITPGDGTNMERDGIIDEWDSSRFGPHTVVGIIPGRRYRLTEDTAGEGYSNLIASNMNSVDFIMDVNGNVTTYDIVSGEPITDMVGSGHELLVKNSQIKTFFSKTSAVTGEEIAGAQLKVCTEESFDTARANGGNGTECEVFVNNEVAVSWTSEAGVTKVVDALPVGKYYLVETVTPVGYVEQVNYVDFEVKADGSITKVVMENTPTKLIIKKLNQVTKERVAGSTLQILNAADRTIAKDADGNELTWVSTADGDWTIYAIPAGKYILVEKVVPEGFQEGMIVDGLSVTEYEFTISDQAGDVNINVGIEVLNAPNTGISTLNLFAIGGLMIFAGYETIKIYRRKALND